MASRPFLLGATAPQAAGVIHSDLQRGCIRAEVIDWRELLEIGSWSKARDVGKLRVPALRELGFELIEPRKLIPQDFLPRFS